MYSNAQLTAAVQGCTVEDGLAADEPFRVPTVLAAAAQVDQQRVRGDPPLPQVHAVVEVAPEALPLHIPAQRSLPSFPALGVSAHLCRLERLCAVLRQGDTVML